jgi:hypothetical protein
MHLEGGCDEMHATTISIYKSDLKSPKLDQHYMETIEKLQQGDL